MKGEDMADSGLPTPVLVELMQHFEPLDILAAEQAMVAAESTRPHVDEGRDYWDEQIWRLTDALFRLQHPRDLNPMPYFRLFTC